MKKIIALILLFIPSICMSATYYIRQGGTAANKAAASGPCATAANTMSVTVHNGETFSAGDIIKLCDDGGKFTTILAPPSAGSGGSYITYAAETGDTPILSGTVAVSSDQWTQTGGYSNVWEAAWAISTPDVVIFDGTPGLKCSSIGNVETSAKAKAFYSDGAKIYTYSTTDPDIAYTIVECSVRGHTMTIGEVDYLIFDGITFQGANNHGVRATDASYEYGPSNIIFRNCTFSMNSRAGLFTNGMSDGRTQNWTLYNNTFSYNGHSGFTAGDYTDTFLISNNIAHHNCQNPVEYQYCGGIRPVNSPDGDAQSSYAISVYKNIIYRNGFWSDDVTLSSAYQGVSADAAGIWMDTMGDNSGSSPCLVYNNIIYDNAVTGLYIENAEGLKAYHNLLWNNGTYGIRNDNSYAAAANQNIKIYNNTVIGATYAFQAAGLYQYTSADTNLDNIVKNNIFIGDTRSIRIVNGAENNHTANGWGSSNIYTFNCLGAESSGFVEWGLGVTYNTYDTWQAATGCGAGVCDEQVEDDPIFIDSANNNYRLHKTSPGINSGTGVFEYKTHPDIIGRWPTGSAASVGAYHFQEKKKIMFGSLPPGIFKTALIAGRTNTDAWEIIVYYLKFTGDQLTFGSDYIVF